MLPITTARLGSMALAVLVLVPLALTADPATGTAAGRLVMTGVP